MSTPRVSLSLIPPSRRLALVLGSGGVRSIAAVGIADVLAREGIRPDLVVGCSSGALFGATIAMGLRSDEALEAAKTLWSPELTRQKRWCAYAQLLAPRLAGFGADFSLRDNRRIAERLDRAFGDRRLETLPTELRVTATAAATGAQVVLREGRVAEALLASMAVPFLFPAVRIDGRLLVDGVVSDPLPIAAADDAGVVLTLGFRGAMPSRIDRASRMGALFTTAMINNLMEARQQAAAAAGRRVLALELELDRRVGLWETAALPALFEAGRQAALRRLPEIRALVGHEQPCRAA